MHCHLLLNLFPYFDVPLPSLRLTLQHVRVCLSKALNVVTKSFPVIDTPGFPPPPVYYLIQQHSPCYPMPSSCPSCWCTCKYKGHTSTSWHSGMWLSDTKVTGNNVLLHSPEAPITIPAPVSGYSLDVIYPQILRKQVGSRINQLEKSVRLAEAMLSSGECHLASNFEQSII
jgi:hypothetical protein